MDLKPTSLLFLCAGNCSTGNSGRAQMAEGWARALIARSKTLNHDDIQVHSAGIEPEDVDPRAVVVMAEAGVDISGQTSKHLQLDARSSAFEQFDWVISQGADAEEHLSALHAKVNYRHWPLDDPAEAKGNEEEVLSEFRRVCVEIRARVKGLIEELEGELSSASTDAELAPSYGADDVEILSCDTPYSGFCKIQRYTLKHRLYQGGWSDQFVRELYARKQAVMVLPYDPMRDQVVLIEQFRVGCLQRRRSPWVRELVAGMVEPGESLEQVARREAMEEAGCELLALKLLYQYWVSPGGTDEKVTLYCAKVDASKAKGIHGLDSENEDIKVSALPREQAFAAIATGAIDNAATIMALQWLQLNHLGLQEDWS